MVQKTDEVICTIKNDMEVTLPNVGAYNQILDQCFAKVQHNTLMSVNSNNKTKTKSKGTSRSGNATDGSLVDLEAVHQFYLCSTATIDQVCSFLTKVSTHAKSTSNPGTNTHSYSFQAVRARNIATINFHTLNNTFNVTGNRYNRMPYVALAMAAHVCDRHKQILPKVLDLFERVVSTSSRRSLVITRGNGLKTKITISGDAGFKTLISYLEEEFFGLSAIQERNKTSQHHTKWSFDKAQWVAVERVASSESKVKILVTSGHPLMDAISMMLGMAFLGRKKIDSHNESWKVKKESMSPLGQSPVDDVTT